MTRARYRGTFDTIAFGTSYFQVVPNAIVTVCEGGTTTPIAATIYEQRSGGATLSNPLTAESDGSLEFFLDVADDVTLVVDGSGVGLGSVTVDWEPVWPAAGDLFTIDSDQTITGYKRFGSGAWPDAGNGTTPNGLEADAYEYQVTQPRAAAFTIVSSGVAGPAVTITHDQDTATNDGVGTGLHIRGRRGWNDTGPSQSMDTLDVRALHKGSFIGNISAIYGRAWASNSYNAGSTATVSGVTKSANVITGVTGLSGGSGYATAPSITVSGGGGSGASLRAVLTNGVVTAVTVVSGGSGYTGTPTVTFSDPAGGSVFGMTSFAGEDGASHSEYSEQTAHEFDVWRTTNASTDYSLPSCTKTGSLQVGRAQSVILASTGPAKATAALVIDRHQPGGEFYTGIDITQAAIDSTTKRAIRVPNNRKYFSRLAAGGEAPILYLGATDATVLNTPTGSPGYLYVNDATEAARWQSTGLRLPNANKLFSVTTGGAETPVFYMNSSNNTIFNAASGQSCQFYEADTTLRAAITAFGISSEAALFGKKISSPSAPASGYSALYAKSDESWYRQTSAGDEVLMLDTNFLTTAGDMIYATADEVAARLAIGVSGTMLTSNGTTPAWSASPNLASGQALTFGAMPRIYGQTVASVADDAAAANCLPNNFTGLLVVTFKDGTANAYRAGWFNVRGFTAAITEVSDPNNVFVTGADTDGSLTLVYSGGTLQFRNRIGNTITDVSFIGIGIA